MGALAKVRTHTLYKKFHDKISEMSKSKKILIISYILILGISFFYVRSVLKKDNIEVYEEEDKSVEKKRSIKVTLKYFDGLENPSVSEFEANLDDTETVEDFLRKLRRSKKIVYEITRYTYGTEIDSVNGVKPKENYKWAVIFNGNDITSNIEKIKLVKKGVYELKMIPK